MGELQFPLNIHIRTHTDTHSSTSRAYVTELAQCKEVAAPLFRGSLEGSTNPHNHHVGQIRPHGCTDYTTIYQYTPHMWHTCRLTVNSDVYGTQECYSPEEEK